MRVVERWRTSALDNARIAVKLRRENRELRDLLRHAGDVCRGAAALLAEPGSVDEKSLDAVANKIDARLGRGGAS